ncbi:DUF4385 domain-containing protein [Cnuella takakiae]|nr:DUF4385 domain-containing protein [Cnuella takakiae]
MKRLPFDYNLDYRNLDLRANPHLYRVGRGEQGVLLVEPYKSELLPLWRFKTPGIAGQSAEAIWQLFQQYKAAGDFVGMDMARKFLQMGYTRSRRYANHKSGKKYDGPVPDSQKGRSGAHGREILPLVADPVKAASAEIFYRYWQSALADTVYQQMQQAHIDRYETLPIGSLKPKPSNL